MNINIRTGKIEDLQEIMALIARCVTVMQAGGSDQWDDQYPNREVIGVDLQRGTLFAAEGEGRILGIIVLDESQDLSTACRRCVLSFSQTGRSYQAHSRRYSATSRPCRRCSAV